MINKVQKLISIGKFRNYTAAGQVNFQKLTAIYGDNGGGKTTLTSVLRSLTSNNPDIIRSRISTNHTQPQAIQITCSLPTGLSHHTFGATGWTTPFPDIEVFDIHFVNENVYSGFDFTEDHKKRLHKFVVGAQGVVVQQQIKKNKIDKAALTQAISDAEQRLIRLVANNMSVASLKAFLVLKPTQAVNIDSLITAADAALVTANSNSTIQTLSRLSQLSPVLKDFDFDAVTAVLSFSTQTVQDDALKALLESHCDHLSENEIDGAETWLRKGFNVIEKVNQNAAILTCPFCKQTLDTNLEILRAYASFFDDSFNEALKQISNRLMVLEAINIDTIALSITKICDANDGHITSWSVHLPTAIIAPINDIMEDVNLLRSTYASIVASLHKKFQNPTSVIDHTDVTEFRAIIAGINDRIEKYNVKTRTYNAGITDFLTKIQTVDHAQAEVHRLRQIKKRFEPAINNICVQLASDKLRLKELQKSYTQLSQQQEASVSTFFSQYKDRINHYLKTVFKTYFQIENVTHIPPQGRALQGKMGYKLVIDGKDISFEANQPFSVKECLSEGDKTTIALAFFLSKLDIDPNRADKILVFDDPLSSLDTNRRMYTIGIIRSLVNQMRQVVVLSHNEHLLYEICKDFSHTVKTTLRITENFMAKASIIEICDLQELVKSEYFKQLEAIIKFRTTPDHSLKDQVLGWLRNVLEGHLNFKFYRVLSTMPGQKTFGNQIKFLKNQGTPFRDDANRLTILGNLNLINSIAWKPHHGDPMPDYASLGINPNSITPSELDNLIQDTLQLIDDQL